MTTENLICRLIVVLTTMSCHHVINGRPGYDVRTGNEGPGAPEMSRVFNLTHAQRFARTPPSGGEAVNKEKLENDLRQAIRKHILQELGVPEDRNRSLVDKVNSQNETRAIQEFIKKQQTFDAPPETKKEKEKKRKITSIGETVPNLLDGRAVQFLLVDGSSSPTSNLLVTGAAIRLMVCHQPPLPAASGKNHRSHDKPSRINIKIYSLQGVNVTRQSSTRGASPDDMTLITKLSVVVKKSRWEKLLLPTSFVQDVLDSADKVLRILIVCDACGESNEIVTRRDDNPKHLQKSSASTSRSAHPTKEKSKSRRHQATDLPHLIIHTKTKTRQTSASSSVNSKYVGRRAPSKTRVKH